MALEFFDGAQWRPISLDEAKYRHAEGQGDRLRDMEAERSEEPEPVNEPSPPPSAPILDEKPAPAPAASPAPTAPSAKPTRDRR